LGHFLSRLFSTLAGYAVTTREALAHSPPCQVKGDPFDV
jgi:hypothetical protein